MTCQFDTLSQVILVLDENGDKACEKDEVLNLQRTPQRKKNVVPESPAALSSWALLPSRPPYS